ncbi:MAG TPA: hypothetical protein VHM19_04540, partial [Polyangiales bacterium]|nr:hypothetical protein [Polyangiales bacterium]
KAEGAGKTIMLAPYPEAARDALRDEATEREMTVLQAVIVAARAIRSERDIHPRIELPLTLSAEDAALRALLERERGAIATLCKANVTLAASSGAADSAQGQTATAVAEGVTLEVALKGLVDDGKEKERIERQIQRLDKDLAAIDKKLGNPGFVDRAPPDVVAKERDRKAELEAARTQLTEALRKLSS